jgi:hypothetical protein
VTMELLDAEAVLGLMIGKLQLPDSSQKKA